MVTLWVLPGMSKFKFDQFILGPADSDHSSVVVVVVTAGCVCFFSAAAAAEIGGGAAAAAAAAALHHLDLSLVQQAVSLIALTSAAMLLHQ